MYKSLQAGRAIAAILVVLFHLGGTIAKEKYFGISGFNIPFLFGGAAGVNFFFVLSGFIILTAHKSDLFKPNRLVHYLKKRIFRIYPVYLIVFVLVSLLVITLGGFKSQIPQDSLTLIKSLLLIPQNKVNELSAGIPSIVIGNDAPVIAVAWTLQYEVFFYLFFALLIFNKWIAAGATAVIGYLMITYMNRDVYSFPIWFLSQPYILLFVIGMLISYLCVIKKLTLDILYPFVVVGGLLFVLVSIDAVCLNWLSKVQQTLLYGLASGLIIFWLVQKENKHSILGSNKWLQTLGDASYSLYLIHNPLISLLCKIFLVLHFGELGMAGALIAYVVIFVLCLTTALLFHRSVEVPIGRWLAKK